jgi:hypothetical protein
MTLGRAERQGRLGTVAVARCEQDLPERSIYRLLHRERDRLFPDELFSDPVRPLPMQHSALHHNVAAHGCGGRRRPSAVCSVVRRRFRRTLARKSRQRTWRLARWTDAA